MAPLRTPDANAGTGMMTRLKAKTKACAESLSMGRKQRSLHEFFKRSEESKNGRKTTRKRARQSTEALRTEDFDGVVKKRIEYDTTSDSDESKSERNATSQSSEDAPMSPLTPTKIDLDDMKKASMSSEEPDKEPFASKQKQRAPSPKFYSEERSQLSPKSTVTIPTQSSLSRLYSQCDEVDFLTPQDQPVMHLSHPTTPSPLKKRHRRDYNTSDSEQDENMVGPLKSTPNSGTLDSCVSGLGPLVPETPMDDLKAICHGPSKRTGQSSTVKKSPKTTRVNAAARILLEPFTNPFTSPFSPPALLEVTKTGSRKRSQRQRQSLPLAFETNTKNLSRYLCDFVEKQLIGAGSFSKVFKCLKKMDGWIYAVKKSKRHFRGNADMQRSLREVQALAALSDSQHIVRYFDAWIEDDLLYIQLEFCQGCSLQYFLNQAHAQNRPFVSEQTLCRVLCHIAKALCDMHARRMVHMDVKVQNFLVRMPNEIYKLGDLGTVVHQDGNMEVTEGDTRYLSRELLEGNRSHLRAGDVFALGASIYELELGKTLPSCGDAWQQIRDGDLVMFRHYSNSLQHLVANMMHPDPLQRPSAEEILQHDVVQSFCCH
uniref:Protein kinase putative n=1 Tax=Albugo laibachii Nc14 TaxID=890382 RepID=F0VYP8_9STRA|nr:protein kinase putative [Albugo laibachii Nc14]|eukprot:CCA13912.1 protein kinase putative [Albugo laibachii Nc14]